jgi:hypothetical protein
MFNLNMFSVCDCTGFFIKCAPVTGIEKREFESDGYHNVWELSVNGEEIFWFSPDQYRHTYELKEDIRATMNLTGGQFDLIDSLLVRFIQE